MPIVIQKSDVAPWSLVIMLQPTCIAYSLCRMTLKERQCYNE